MDKKPREHSICMKAPYTGCSKLTVECKPIIADFDHIDTKNDHIDKIASILPTGNV